MRAAGLPLLAAVALGACKAEEPEVTPTDGSNLTILYTGILNVTDAGNITSRAVFDVPITGGKDQTVRHPLYLVAWTQSSLVPALDEAVPLDAQTLGTATLSTIESRGYAEVDGNGIATVTGRAVLKVKAEERVGGYYEDYLVAESRGEDLTQTRLYELLSARWGTDETTPDRIAESGAAAGAEFTQWLFDTWNADFVAVIDGLVDGLEVPIYTTAKAHVTDENAQPYVQQVYLEETRKAYDPAAYIAESQERMWVVTQELDTGVLDTGDTADTGAAESRIGYEVWKIGYAEVEAADTNFAETAENLKQEDGNLYYVVDWDAGGNLVVVDKIGEGEFEFFDPAVTIPANVINPATDTLDPLNYYAELKQEPVYGEDPAAPAYYQYTFALDSSGQPTRSELDLDGSDYRLEFVPDLSVTAPEAIDVVDPFLFANPVDATRFYGWVNSAYTHAPDDFILFPVDGYAALHGYYPVNGMDTTYLPENAARFYLGTASEAGYEPFHAANGFQFVSPTRFEIATELNSAAAGYIGYLPLMLALYQKE
jgi:hypothetical protein